MRLHTLPFNVVMELYCQRVNADLKNDIRQRTRLLRHYPELFNHTIFKELKAVYEKCNALTKSQQRKPVVLAHYRQTKY